MSQRVERYLEKRMKVELVSERGRGESERGEFCDLLVFWEYGECEWEHEL